MAGICLGSLCSCAISGAGPFCLSSFFYGGGRWCPPVSAVLGQLLQREP